MKMGSRDIFKTCVTLSELRRLTQREIPESRWKYALSSLVEQSSKMMESKLFREGESAHLVVYVHQSLLIVIDSS